MRDSPIIDIHVSTVLHPISFVAGKRINTPQKRNEDATLQTETEPKHDIDPQKRKAGETLQSEARHGYDIVPQKRIVTTLSVDP
jgi:hypothetical protein